MAMPNFLIIGAAKSGTSALYHYVRQHPNIYMSPRKETHFFAFVNGNPNTSGPGDTIPNAVTNLDDYKLLFEGVSREEIVGEASPTYLYIPGTADRIKQYIPNVKMVAILRNPVDRAYSAYMHLIRDGREPIPEFKKALDMEDKRIEANWGPIWHYKYGGLYYVQLKRYYDIFNKDQIRIYLYDDFNQDPIGLLQDIFRFLDIDDTWVPDVSIRPNVSGVPRSMALHKFLHRVLLQPNPVKSLSRKVIPEDIRFRTITQIRNKNIKKQPMSPDVRKYLVDWFREDISNLEGLIDRRLSFWLE